MAATGDNVKAKPGCCHQIGSQTKTRDVREMASSPMAEETPDGGRQGCGERAMVASRVDMECVDIVSGHQGLWRKDKADARPGVCSSADGRSCAGGPGPVARADQPLRASRNPLRALASPYRPGGGAPWQPSSLATLVGPSVGQSEAGLCNQIVWPEPRRRKAK